MDNFFAYGSLMCDEIMQEVSGCRLPHELAVLTGYSRRSIRGESYPAIVPVEHGRVEGIVYRKVPSSAWRRLDRFEVEMYARELVRITLNGGAILFAGTYVVQPKYRDRLEPTDWDYADFLRNYKANFQRTYQGYKSLTSNRRGDRRIFVSKK